MDTIIREGYVKKGKVLGKSMKKKYLLLRCASEKSMTAQLEVYDDQKQVRKNSFPNGVISMKSVAGVKRIETPLASGATLKDGGCFIRLDVNTDRGGVEEVYLSLDNRDLFEEWLTDLEFLVRLPDLIIPLPYIPKRELPLLNQTSIDKKLFGEIEFEDACPVETVQTELGLKWQLNNRLFILVLTQTTLIFLDPQAGIHALTYNIQNLRRCGHWQKLVFIESGRRTDTGPGYLWLYIHSKVLAKNFYTTLSSVMGSTQQMMVIQKHLCWDKFREDLPPGSARSLADDSAVTHGSVSDNDTYGIESLEYIQGLTACPPLPPHHPKLHQPPLEHRVTHEHTPHKKSDSQSHRSPSRQEDNILPLTPLDSMKRRASLPGRDQRSTSTDNKEASTSYRADTFNGVHVKTRYDMLVPGDTHDLQVGANGQVETKYNFANTDGKGNIIDEGSKRPEHSYYDVNDIIAELGGKARSPTPKKKRSIHKNDNSKFNTISVVKLSNTASKEKIGRSTFYKTSMPILEPVAISPYAKFSDLDSQVPQEVRRERIKQLSLRQNASMDHLTSLGTPLSPVHASVPNTPLVLYASPQDTPIEVHYKLVDPKPRPVLGSSSSLPEVTSVGDMSLYNSPNNFPINQDYQHPLNNAEVLLVPSEDIGAEENTPILNMTGDYDRLKSDGDNGIIFLEDHSTSNILTESNRENYPLYEKMVSGSSITPEQNGVSLTDSQETDNITFKFSVFDYKLDKHSLDTLLESPLMGNFLCDEEIGNANESTGQGSCAGYAVTTDRDVPRNMHRDQSTNCDSPETIDGIQKMSSQTNVSDVIELDTQVYETMTDLSIQNTRSSVSDSLVGNRYQNIYPFKEPPLLTTKPTNLLRRESSPQFTKKSKPVLQHGAQSFAFSRGFSSDKQSIYYAELDLCSKDNKSTVIVNTIHSSAPSTHYDKIDLKVSNILQETVQHHRGDK